MINANQLPRKHREELPVGKTIEICRCWLAAEFPYCDGAHKKHNAETGDNVGPAVITAVPANSDHKE